jgi:hypothetical protein
VVVSSPAHLKRLPTHLNWTPCRAVFCSGGVLPAEVALSASRLLGSVPIEIYGSSETGGVAWRQRADQFDDAWTPMPGVQWRIEPDTQLIDVRSAHLFTDNWLTLADRVQVTDNGQTGQFILLGRSDRIVKIEEKRISLDAIESRLGATSWVEEIKVLVGQTGRTGEQSEANYRRQYLAAVVVLTDAGRDYLQQHGKLALNRQLIAVLSGAMEPVSVPRRWRYVDQFPTNAQGKITLSLLQALFDDAQVQVNAPEINLRRRDDLQPAQHAEFDVRWPGNLRYFVGHFPDTPILPGVAQVHWAINIARTIFTMPTNFHSMQALKFQHVILPDQLTLLKLDYDERKHSLSFSFTSTTKQYSSGRVLFHD